MSLQTTDILKRILTTLMVIFTLYVVYVLSAVGSLAISATLQPAGFEQSWAALLMILVAIALIIIIPLVKIVVKSSSKKWDKTLHTCLALWPYLIISFLVLYVSILISSKLQWLDLSPPLLPTEKQPQFGIYSGSMTLLLATAYYFYVKKIKKLLLK